MAIRLIGPEQFRRMPWKNGGGETIEIAAHPEGADLAGFDWRISMARVAGDGPFSRFDGIDRSLSMLEGGRLVLTFENRIVPLGTGSEPYSFAGDEPCSGAVPDGPIVDFNVMTRRGRMRHAVRRLTGKTSWRSKASTVLAFAHQGRAEMHRAGGMIALPEGFAVLATDEAELTLAGQVGSTLYLVEIEPA